MTSNKPFTPPSPSTLMARYLQEQARAHAAGLTNAAMIGDVQPYEAGPVQPVDGRPAWKEALAVLEAFGLNDESTAAKAPPGWMQLVTIQAPAFDVPFCIGNFPQMVRNLHPLLMSTRLSELRQKSTQQTVEVPALVEWADKVTGEKNFQRTLLAIGALRLAKGFDKARAALESIEAQIPEEWKPVWTNEKAALAWCQGDAEAAYAIWKAEPETAVSLFNRGMAALFLDKPAEAKEPLKKAVKLLSEDSPWHHLARLYVTLACSL